MSQESGFGWRGLDLYAKKKRKSVGSCESENKNYGFRKIGEMTGQAQQLPDY